MSDQNWQLAQDRLINQLDRRLRAAEDKINMTAQALPAAYAGGGGAGNGQAVGLCWARIPSGGVAAATGTWPTYSPSTFSADVYSYGTSGPTLKDEGATIRWWYLDAGAEGKMVPCVRHPLGGYDAILDSCTEIPLDE